MKSLIEEFQPGTVFNKLNRRIGPIKLVNKKVLVKVPARINTMVFDTASLASPKRRGIYTAGELLISAKLYTQAEIQARKDKKIEIEDKTKRKSIILHTARILQKELKLKNGFCIKVRTKNNLIHSGFGSSAALQIAVGIGINKLYNNPLSKEELMKFLSQNYGEEITDSKKLVHVQSNGGGLAAALYGGGIIALAGEAVVINQAKVPKEFEFVIGIPRSFKQHDAKIMIKKEETVFRDMQKDSTNHAPEIAWQVLHKILPAMKEGNIYQIGSVIDYCKINFGSLRNDGVLWPELVPQIMKLRGLRNEKTPILSYSSCGPAIFVLTKEPKKIMKEFQKNNLNTFILKVDNQGAIVKIF
jgi:predicted sugar kinase